jgi:hypothetical protein
MDRVINIQTDRQTSEWQVGSQTDSDGGLQTGRGETDRQTDRWRD